ncbi:SDR family oxidoreductase [Candidatus Parcubacteria bacterium]|nr:MAG: SDR family oxidoreductase [Candidatus Parcubacteria bacterium]
MRNLSVLWPKKSKSFVGSVSKVSTVLLTGATGYLGSHLACTLLARGYQVIALKRCCSSLRRLEKVASRIIFYDIDRLDFSEPFRRHAPISAVIHAATCYGRNGESPSEILTANILFPLQVFEAAYDSGVPLFINCDTSLEKYLNPYSLSKKQFVEWGRYFAKQGNLQFINARIEHFYGPDDDPTKFTSHVINCCLRNDPELKLTAGEQKRDFIYIDDVVTAILTLLEKADEIMKGFCEFDVGSGKAVSIREFVETVKRLSGATTKLKFGAIPYRDGEVMHSEADISKLQALGWQLQYTLEQGLKKTITGAKA